MQVLVLGSKKFIRWFSYQENNGLQITGISDLNELPTLLASNKFEIILINGSEKNAGEICNLVKEASLIPVALLISETQVKWKELDLTLFDGFIPKQASWDELKARFNAVIRRHKILTAK